jgi:phage terminase large subunit
MNINVSINKIDLNSLADATYAAMFYEPAFVNVAKRLVDCTAAERESIVKNTPAKDMEKVISYLSAPELTRERERRLQWMRADPRRVSMLKVYYKDHVAQFIDDWGVTSDPRELANGKSVLIPFRLWPKQFEMVDWMMNCFHTSTPGACVKGRDVGASWVAMALLCTLCIFQKGFAGGIGSATELKLDRSGDPNTLLWKAREFMKHLPEEFRAGYIEEKHALYLRMLFPETGSSITGEAGTKIGRGGRNSIYVVDEAAFLENPMEVSASLAANTNCRLDVSTPNGVNAFFDHYNNPAVSNFHMSWRDDPRKDQAWYEKKKSELDPVVFAQEIDASFYASAEGVLVPPQWVSSSIGLLERLGLEASGVKIAALDVADLGKDRCAWAARHGNAVLHAVSWTGTGTDIHGTTERAFLLCDMYGIIDLVYDSTGVGAGVRGAARVINHERVTNGLVPIRVHEYVAGATPMFPDKMVPGTNRRAKDLFLNRSAQTAWYIRRRFEAAHNSAGGNLDEDGMISINPAIPEIQRLIAEFSQPCIKETPSGKWQLEKTPKGAKSPNLYDAVAMCFAPRKTAMVISDVLLHSMAAPLIDTVAGRH